MTEETAPTPGGQDAVDAVDAVDPVDPVDAALERVAALDEVPVAEHVAVYERAHEVLRSALTDAGRPLQD